MDVQCFLHTSSTYQRCCCKGPSSLCDGPTNSPEVAKRPLIAAVANIVMPSSHCAGWEPKNGSRRGLRVAVDAGHLATCCSGQSYRSRRGTRGRGISVYVRLPITTQYLTKATQHNACGEMEYPPQSGPPDALLELIESQRLADETAKDKLERARERKKEVANKKRERQTLDTIAKGKRTVTDPRGGPSCSSVSSSALLLFTRIYSTASRCSASREDACPQCVRRPGHGRRLIS